MNNAHIMEFSSNVLADMDAGALGAEITRQIQIACRDIQQRPMDINGKATGSRKVKIGLSFAPILTFNKQTESKELTGIHVEPTVDGTSPAVTGGRTELRISPRGAILFNKLVPGSFDQMPLPFEDEEVVAEDEEAA